MPLAEKLLQTLESIDASLKNLAADSDTQPTQGRVPAQAEEPTTPRRKLDIRPNGLVDENGYSLAALRASMVDRLYDK